MLYKTRYTHRIHPCCSNLVDSTPYVYRQYPIIRRPIVCRPIIGGPIIGGPIIGGLIIRRPISRPPKGLKKMAEY